jgi:hypothetical protein
MKMLRRSPSDFDSLMTVYQVEKYYDRIEFY